MEKKVPGTFFDSCSQTVPGTLIPLRANPRKSRGEPSPLCGSVEYTADNLSSLCAFAWGLRELFFIFPVKPLDTSPLMRYIYHSEAVRLKAHRPAPCPTLRAGYFLPWVF